MRLRLPFDGAFPVTQRFGMRPEVYGKYGKYGLPGHEGIDWGLPRGTPVRAVDAGTVNLVKSAGNYGNHVRIVHPWGESVCAHLDKVLVSMGASVTAGQVLGLSGNSGNSEGPHLHYGMRVAPFFREPNVDKWQGFCDGWEFFQPERPIMGPHIVNGNAGMLETLRRWQPAAITVLDPDAQFVADVRAACPQTAIVGRIYRPDSEVGDRIKADPKVAAAWMHALVTGHAAFGTGAVSYWQVANEVCQAPWDDFVKLDACMSEWMTLAGDAYHCGLYAFGVGHPEAPVNDGNWWRQITPTLERAAKAGHVLLVHEYGCCPGVEGPLANGKPATAWYAQRYVNQVRPYLQARTIKVIVSEFGYDGLIGGTQPAGWQTSGLTAAQYADQLLAFGERYGRYRDQVLGVCVYTWGHNAPWGSYDIAGEVVERLADSRQQAAGSGEDGQAQGPAPTEEQAAAVAAAGKGVKRLSLNAEAALQKAIVKAGYAVTSDEFGFEHGGGRFVGQWGERTDGKARATVFYCQVGRWDDVRQAVEAAR